MEYIDKWPKSDISENLDEITSDIKGLNKTKTTAFTKAIAEWRNDAAKIRTEVECEMEDAANNIESAGEFIKNGTFIESRQGDLRRACEKHSKRMLDFITQANDIQKTDF